MKVLRLFFQCLFYTGSWVSEKKYENVLSHIQSHPLVENVQIHKPFQEPDKNRNDTVLIGHSLGGYYALRDAMKFPERVAGVVLWNSHFNSRGVMSYPRIPLHKVPKPVLTILAGNDERLPIRKAMDDSWECSQDRVFDKYFVINQYHGHFTGITGTEGSEKIILPTYTFIQALATRNFSMVRAMETHRRRFIPENYYLSDNAVVVSRPVNFIDALLKIVSPLPLWDLSHFIWFLTSKPTHYMGYLYVDDHHIYLKGSPRDEANYNYLLEEWVRDVPTQIQNYILPTIHPSILFWLFFPISPTWDGKSIKAPIIILKVNNQTTYYKVPNPRKFFSILPEDSFFG